MSVGWKCLPITLLKRFNWVNKKFYSIGH